MNKILGTLLIGLMLTVDGSIVRAGQLEDGGVAYQMGDYATALRVFRLLAEQGNAPAQKNLGYMYYTGNGVTQDYREAMNWFRLAAEQGNASAQFLLGTMYIIGEGLTQDPREAMKWFRLAAEQGEAGSQYFLGRAYDEGRGVTQDYREGQQAVLFCE